MIKAPLSGGKKENNPIKAPSRLRRIHQAEGSSVMSQRRLIYTTRARRAPGSHTKTKKTTQLGEKTKKKKIKQSRLRLIVAKATFLQCGKRSVGWILHLLIYDCLFPFYFPRAKFLHISATVSQVARTLRADLWPSPNIQPPPRS